MGDNGWGLPPVGDGGTHLQSWLDVLRGLSLAEDSDLGYCGVSAEACLDLGLVPLVAQPHGHS